MAAFDPRTELEAVEQQMRELEAVAAYLRRRLSETGAENHQPRTRRRKGRPTAATAAAEVLAQSKKPMRTPDLLREVQAMGAQMKDVDSLYKTLGRSDRFKRVGRGSWTLA